MAKEHELCQYTVKVWKKEIPSNVGKQETFVEKVKKVRGKPLSAGHQPEGWRRATLSNVAVAVSTAVQVC